MVRTFKGIREEQRVHGRRGVCYTHIKEHPLTYKQLRTKIEKNEEKNSESVGADG